MESENKPPALNNVLVQWGKTMEYIGGKHVADSEGGCTELAKLLELVHAHGNIELARLALLHAAIVLRYSDGNL